MTAPFTQQVTFLYTSDLVATARFYEAIIGLPLALDQGNCRIYRVSADGFLGFCARRGAQPSGVIVTFVTPDVDGWYDRLCAQGVVFEKAPVFNPDYNIYHCFLRDPNGYLLEIQRFCDPAWPQPSLPT
ncbi:MAG TPA: glyoxalase [Chloroflexi bacterium]|nr:glyoxalase [Chloroflexota bacterium]HHW89130.1 VOC family protein [Chloroflexota bacterium]